MTASPRMPDQTQPVQRPPLQRSPVRVSFQSGDSAKQTFAIRGHVVDLVNDAEEEEESK